MVKAHTEPENKNKEDEEKFQFIKHGDKKQRIKFIRLKQLPKVRALYYKQAVTKNENLEEKEKYIEAYHKEMDNLINMEVI